MLFMYPLLSLPCTHLLSPLLPFTISFSLLLSSPFLSFPFLSFPFLSFPFLSSFFIWSLSNLNSSPYLFSQSSVSSLLYSDLLLSFFALLSSSPTPFPPSSPLYISSPFCLPLFPHLLLLICSPHFACSPRDLLFYCLLSFDLFPHLFSSNRLLSTSSSLLLSSYLYFCPSNFPDSSSSVRSQLLRWSHNISDYFNNFRQKKKICTMRMQMFWQVMQWLAGSWKKFIYSTKAVDVWIEEVCACNLSHMYNAICSS